MKKEEYAYIGFFKDRYLISTQRILLSELGEDAHAKLSDYALDNGYEIKTIYKELYHNHSPFDKYSLTDLEEYYKNKQSKQKTNNMKNYYTQIGNIIKEGGSEFEIVGHKPAGLIIKKKSSIEKDLPEHELSFTELPELMASKKIIVSKCENDILCDLPYENERDKILLQNEITAIELSHKNKSLSGKNEELTLSKISKSGKTAKLKHDLKEKDKAVSETMAGVEAMFKNELADSLTNQILVNGKDKWRIESAEGTGTKTINFKAISQTGSEHYGNWSDNEVRSLLNGGKVAGWKVLEDKKLSRPEHIHKLVDEFAKFPTWQSSGLSQITPGKYEKFINDLINSTNEFTDAEDLENFVMTKMDLKKYGAEESPITKRKKVSVKTKNSKWDDKLNTFLKKFPNDAKEWDKATDEIRDVAKLIRDAYNEQVLNVLENEDGYIKGLEFRDFKTPSQWNTEAKKQILHLWILLPENVKKNVIESREEWFESETKKAKSLGKTGFRQQAKEKNKGKKSPKRGTTTLSERKYIRANDKEFKALKDAYPDLTYKQLIAKHKKTTK